MHEVIAIINGYDVVDRVKNLVCNIVHDGPEYQRLNMSKSFFHGVK